MIQRYGDGGRSLAAAAYSRAVRRGSIVAVSGTAAIGPDGVLHPGDTEGQTRAAFELALNGLRELGGALEDVVRTRMFLAPDADPQGAVRVHKELFEGNEPANTTLYVHGFIPEGVLVEVELDAVLEGAE